MSVGYIYVCTHDFEAVHEDELNLVAGDDVEIIENRADTEDQDTWWTVSESGSSQSFHVNICSHVSCTWCVYAQLIYTM